MHRSRLQSVVVDCHDLDAGISFWTGALGVGVEAQDGPYRRLGSTIPGLKFLLQRVPEPKTTKSRVHLDIESDDLEAEVKRLEELGARRVEQIEEWWVMEDPCGNEFCVVPASTPDFASAHIWEP
jgi:catechol 2,3-dioxygenase-like lactoylglutathione lyase family enzyme